jgi:hypothetical protein
VGSATERVIESGIDLRPVLNRLRLTPQERIAAAMCGESKSDDEERVVLELEALIEMRNTLNSRARKRRELLM